MSGVAMHRLVKVEVKGFDSKLDYTLSVHASDDDDRLERQERLDGTPTDDTLRHGDVKVT